MSISEKTVGVVGAGNMGGAIVRGLALTGTVEPSRLHVCDPDAPKLAALAAETGCRPHAALGELVAAGPEVVVLAVKPQVLPAFLESAADDLAGRLVVSIAAGVPLATLEAGLPGSRVIRVMPNLPIAVRSGATSVTPGTRSTAEDLADAVELFGSMGSAQVFTEAQLDVAAAVVGTAPAFFALFVDTLTEAAIRRGLPAASARDMLVATMGGVAAQLGDEAHPRCYVERVTSPGGTTAAALRELEPLLLEGSHRAVDAAAARADELAGR